MTDWRTDEKVNGIRNLAHERFMDEARQYERGFPERFRLRWSFTQDELNALCDAVAAVSRGGEEWRCGYTLDTAQTQRWSKEQREANDREEGRRIFLNFHEHDQGRSRKLLAVCETPEQASMLVELHGAAIRTARAARAAGEGT